MTMMFIGKKKGDFDITTLGMDELCTHIESILPADLKEKFEQSQERPNWKALGYTNEQILDLGPADEMEKSIWFGGEDAIKLADLLKANPCEMLDDTSLQRSGELDIFLRQSGGFIIR